jgi:hypothetical protein
MKRFTLRDLFWLVALVGAALGGYRWRDDEVNRVHKYAVDCRVKAVNLEYRNAALQATCEHQARMLEAATWENVELHRAPVARYSALSDRLETGAAPVRPPEFKSLTP